MVKEKKEKYAFHYAGCLKGGHNGWVTQVVTDPKNPNLLISSSRDKTSLIWNLEHQSNGAVITGHPVRALKGHSHFVSDICLSSDSGHLLSGSWDKTLRIWDLEKGVTSRRFVGHSMDVLSVDFSPDNRQIISGSRDKSIKMWNTLAKCMHTIHHDCHTDWVSSVRFTPEGSGKIVSTGWDGVVKIWNPNLTLKTNHIGHQGYLNALTVSPDGSLLASGGRDGAVHLWEDEKHLGSLSSGDIIKALAFNPDRYWVACGVVTRVEIWDLQTKKVIGTCTVEDTLGKSPEVTSLGWNSEGTIIFAGFTDNAIRIWRLVVTEIEGVSDSD